MASGVTVNDAVVQDYQSLKLKKNNKFIIFRLNDTMSEIIVDKASDNPDYDEFLKLLPKTEPRWVVYDFEYEIDDGGKRNKLSFIAWTPDEAKIKLKMVYAASKDALRKSLVGIGAEIQATDDSEIAYDDIVSKFKSKSR